MNSIWNKNIGLFSKRFPQLYDMLSPSLKEYSCGQDDQEQTGTIKILQAKDGNPSAQWNNLALHSKYNPLREAQSLIQGFDGKKHSAAAFFSFGLGYGPIEFAKKNPLVPLYIIEPDIDFLNAAFSFMDWEAVLSHNQVVFIINAPEETAEALFKNHTDKSLCVFSIPSQTAHKSQYFQNLAQILKKNRQKEEINGNTLERFAHLWLKNSCRNLKYLQSLDGIEKFRNLGKDMAFTVLAAGPSLNRLLPYLKEIQKRSIIVCVDTALHACLRMGVEPDFIILVDPQYACAMHLEFLSSPSSILITESAAWPSVFRFNCRETVLCSSLFPMGQYFEKQLGCKGKLGAGGSVTTTAWDFCRICGAKEIYIAAMDLGFPSKETHVRGSQFEERIHRISGRLHTSEQDNLTSLLSANPKTAVDYRGMPILTDTRMSLFSWWFENNCALSLKEGQKTFSLTPESLAINGIEAMEIQQFLELPELDQKRSIFFETAESRALPKPSKEEFNAVLEEFKQNLMELNALAKKARDICEKTLQNRTRLPQSLKDLSFIDNQILNSSAKEAASLVFPTQRQMEKLSENLPQDPELAPIHLSRLIYTRLSKAIREYLGELEKI